MVYFGIIIVVVIIVVISVYNLIIVIFYFVVVSESLVSIRISVVMYLIILSENGLFGIDRLIYINFINLVYESKILEIFFYEYIIGRIEIFITIFVGSLNIDLLFNIFYFNLVKNNFYLGS